MKHYHYEIQGYNSFEYMDNNTKDFKMFDMSIIDVLAKTEKTALKKAKGLLKKTYYRVDKVYECHQSDIDQSLVMDIQLTQIEMQKKTLDAIKGLYE